MNLFGNLWQDLLALGILVTFALIVWSRMTKKTVTDVLKEVREALKNANE